jgi:antitoxin (DNA-binding transcriptional repressor) of toxin-antitoxin stability system
MAVLRISEADLARDVRAVLDRVQSGAEIIVERDAQPVAVLRAAEPRRRKLSEIAAALAQGSTAVVDPCFAQDVQAVIDRHRGLTTAKLGNSRYTRRKNRPIPFLA